MIRLCVILGFAAIAACSSGTAVPFAEIKGTWGGENAGLIAEDTVAHVHIGCTLGYAKGPINISEDGHFEAIGTYNVDAFPIDRGIIHPASFSGQIKGESMTLTVVLTDNGKQLGPVTLVYGKEPKMGPCPICRKAEWSAAARQLELLQHQHQAGAAGTRPISSRN